MLTYSTLFPKTPQEAKQNLEKKICTAEYTYREARRIQGQVAVKALKLSHHNPETIVFFTIYSYYGKLIYAP